MKIVLECEWSVSDRPMSDIPRLCRELELAVRLVDPTLIIRVFVEPEVYEGEGDE